MTRVLDVIRRLLPNGSRPKISRSLLSCPNWPPDVFAVTATLIEKSGCYSSPSYVGGWAKCYQIDKSYLTDVENVGALWAKDPTKVPYRVAKLWRELLKKKNETILVPRRLRYLKPKEPETDWRDIALRLLAMADEASAGVGFLSHEQMSIFVYEQHSRFLEGQTTTLRNLPYSLCENVPLEEACVQPKATTPQVGCTLRSLTHHLALLPPVGVVTTDWIYGHPNIERSTARPLNLLLVPFPYMIRGSSFVAEPSTTFLTEASPYDRYFSLDMSWLKHRGADIPPREMGIFLSNLVREAKRETGEVHGVLLPEGALTPNYADEVAKTLASEHADLELFVTGYLDSGKPSDFFPVNGALTYSFNQDGEFKSRRPQAKHHRWKLDGSQVARYQLGHALDPTLNWWEKINVEKRTCQFTNVRPGASFAVLICEDLARSDPVLPILNAVGPNLVIALLMDGPQLKFRWPARYAMALADDPGSSVLTLTSLGMVKRSSLPGDGGNREIALWKHPGGDIQELRLPRGDHGLLLTLSMVKREQWTLDLRSDHVETRQFHLAGVRGVRLSDEPLWVSGR